MQYQAAGLPVVANPVGSHREMVQGGETGFLASTPGEWMEALIRLVGDATLRRKMGQQARKKVESDYSVSAWADTFVTSATGFSPGSTRGSWKIDRALSVDGRKGFEPHLARTKAPRTLNQIGDR